MGSITIYRRAAVDEEMRGSMVLTERRFGKLCFSITFNIGKISLAGVILVRIFAINNDAE